MRIIKNWFGSIRGFGCCPNCGDSYRWKPTSNGLIYEQDRAGFGDIQNGTIILYTGSSRSVLICEECLENPESLDADKIVNDLSTLDGWVETNLDMVRSAVTNFKNTHA